MEPSCIFDLQFCDSVIDCPDSSDESFDCGHGR